MRLIRYLELRTGENMSQLCRLNSNHHLFVTFMVAFFKSATRTETSTGPFSEEQNKQKKPQDGLFSSMGSWADRLDTNGQKTQVKEFVGPFFFNFQK